MDRPPSHVTWEGCTEGFKECLTKRCGGSDAVHPKEICPRLISTLSAAEKVVLKGRGGRFSFQRRA